MQVPMHLFNTKRYVLTMSKSGIDLPSLIKPLAEDPVTSRQEHVIAITHCEHDLVERALFDPKHCKFGNVVGIDLTLPIV